MVGIRALFPRCSASCAVRRLTRRRQHSGPATAARRAAARLGRPGRRGPRVRQFVPSATDSIRPRGCVPEKTLSRHGPRAGPFGATCEDYQEDPAESRRPGSFGGGRRSSPGSRLSRATPEPRRNSLCRRPCVAAPAGRTRSIALPGRGCKALSQAPFRPPPLPVRAHPELRWVKEEEPGRRGEARGRGRMWAEVHP